MKLKYILTTAFIAILFPACGSLPYQDDTGFSNSSQADSPEFPVYVDGHLCKDVAGLPGVCSKRIKSTDTVSFHIDPQQYAYNLDIACTSPVAPPPSVSVPKNTELDFTMQGPYALDSFVCIGEIFPQDRPQPLSAKWEIRVAVSDNDPISLGDTLSVNSVDCKDMDGKESFCSLRTGSTTAVGFSIPAQPLAYTLDVTCSSGVVAPAPIPVAAGAIEQFTMQPPYPVESFVCTGQMVPTSGPTLNWDVRIVVRDQAYQPRESIEFVTQNGDTYLVLGQYAKYAWVFDGTSWSNHSKDTMIKVDDPSVVKAYSESYEMRYNFLNMDAPVETN